MSPRSHPSSTLLANYATGVMPIAPGITISAHLESCRECRRRVAGFEKAEGSLIEDSPPAPMAPDALQRLLARIDAEPAVAVPPVSDEPDMLGDVALPRAVARTGLGSRRFLGRGLWVAPVRAPRTGGWRTSLLRAPARTTIPTHCHRGGELIAVLVGSFEDGQRFDAGDFGENVAGSHHHLQVSAEGPCVCLISTQGRVQWRGWAKMIAPLLGI